MPNLLPWISQKISKNNKNDTPISTHKQIFYETIELLNYKNIYIYASKTEKVLEQHTI